MTLTAEQRLAAFDAHGQELASIVRDPGFQDDPYPVYAWQREAEPRLDTGFGLWFLSTHADAVAVLRDPHMSSDEQHSTLFQTWAAAPDTPDPVRMPVMLFMDPPDHTRLRGLVAQAFTPRMVESLRPRAEEVVGRLLDTVEQRGDRRLDVIADLAYPLPVTIICEMLGIPIEDHPRFSEWSKGLVRSLDPGPLRSPDDEAQIVEAAIGLAGYVLELLARRRADPGDDLLSALLAAEAEGDRLSEQELLATTLLLLVAGHETTVNLIGNGTLALLRHPDQLARVRDEPGLERSAVDELLRYDSPVQMTQRIATDDVALGETTLRAGENVIVMLGAANHDPATFPDPDRLDVGREEARKHVAFGGGIHYCLGAALARVEAEVAIPALLRRFPTLELAGEVERRPTFTLRGLARLPAAW